MSALFGLIVYFKLAMVDLFLGAVVTGAGFGCATGCGAGVGAGGGVCAICVGSVQIRAQTLVALQVVSQ